MYQKPQSMSNFTYMNTADFFVEPTELAIATAASLAGGSLYGGTYVGTKMLMGEDLQTPEARREVAANTSAGTISGLGGYLITKALQRKTGIV